MTAETFDGPVARAPWRARAAGVLAGVARVAGRFVRGPRRVSLPGMGALACFAAAGYTVSLTVGLVVAGASLLIVDWRMSGSGE